MRIVKYGVQKTFITTCPNCLCDIEYTLKEIKNVRNHQEDYQMVRGFICPCCEEVVEPDYKEVE